MVAVRHDGHWYVPRDVQADLAFLRSLMKRLIANLL